MTTRLAGSISRLATDKGFGFIRDDGGRDFFVHYTALPPGAFDALRVGERVTFVGVETPKGLRAEAVVLA